MIKKKKSCMKAIHLVYDDGLYDRKVITKWKIGFYLLFMNDGKFINYLAISLGGQYLFEILHTSLTVKTSKNKVQSGYS